MLASGNLRSNSQDHSQAVSWLTQLRRRLRPADVPQFYRRWMEQGIHVVTPNKKLNSGPLSEYLAVKQLQRAGRAHYMWVLAVAAVTHRRLLLPAAAPFGNICHAGTNCIGPAKAGPGLLLALIAGPSLWDPPGRYEGTVGAGLPVISTVKTLLDTGDEVQRIEGVFRWAPCLSSC
jgi:hypothetical protein